MSEDASHRRVAPPAGWDAAIAYEFGCNQLNGCVGHVLVSETSRVRVWSLRLRPGERIGFHRHVLDYFWTAVTAGRATSRHHDGRLAVSTYAAGTTKHLAFGPGEFMVHDLTNTGDTELVFTTVEFLGGANPPLPVPEHVRRDCQTFDRHEAIPL
jgi:hypothetical protein